MHKKFMLWNRMFKELKLDFSRQRIYLKPRNRFIKTRKQVM